MNQSDNQLILSFDMLYTNNHIQILKLLLPCFEPDIQKKLAVMIKYLELQHTLAYFRKNPALCGAVCTGQPQSVFSGSSDDIIEIFSRIRAFCTPTERALFDQFSALKKNMEKYEEILNMVQLFSEFSAFSENTASGDTAASSNSMDFLKNMLTDEQQALFDLFTAAQ